MLVLAADGRGIDYLSQLEIRDYGIYPFLARGNNPVVIQHIKRLYPTIPNLAGLTKKYLETAKEVPSFDGHVSHITHSNSAKEADEFVKELALQIRSVPRP